MFDPLKNAIGEFMRDADARVSCSEAQAAREEALPPLTITITLNAIQWGALLIAVGATAKCDESLMRDLRPFFEQVNLPIKDYYGS